MAIFSRTPEGDSTFCGDPLWSAKFMYALGSAGASSILNFLPVFYEEAGFDKVQIGYLQTLPCICFMVGPPFWGLIGDRFQSPRAIYNICVLSGAALMYVCQFFSDFYWVALLIVLSFFQSTPAGSFLDMIILDLIDKYGGEYGKQRLFGAIGWGLAAYLAGMLVASFGLSWAFNLNMIYGVGTVLMLRAVPDPRRKVEGYSEIESGKDVETGPQSLGDSIKLIFHQVDVLILLCVVFLMGLMYGVLSSFLTLNLYNLSGYDPRIIGVAIMCETTSELPAFFFADKLINKIGTVNVLLISIAGYAARITFYAFMTNAWTAIPFEFLHGVTFALAWTAVTQYVYAAAPKGCEGTMMGMLNSAQNGVGRGCGTLIGGYLWERYNPRTMWLVTDMGVPLSIVGVFLFACLKENIDAKKAEQAAFVAGKKSPATYDSVN